MKAPKEAFDKTVLYVKICSGGALFIVAYNVLASIFRGIGDSKTPLMTVLIACFINIGGDLLFVVRPIWHSRQPLRRSLHRQSVW